MTQQQQHETRTTRIQELLDRQEQYKPLGFKLSRKEKAELKSLQVEEQQYQEFEAARQEALKGLFG